MTTTLIQDVRPWGGAPSDVTLRDGLVAAVAPAGAGVVAPGATVIDGARRLLLPSFTDTHVHLDSTRIGLPFRPHSAQPGGLWNLIDNDRQNWRDAELPVAERAALTLGRAIEHGMTRARAFAQVDADCGLERLEGVVAAREAHRDRADVQIVAFPQAGILLEPGVPDLLDAALRSGADAIGGLDPCGLDRDPVRHLDVVFGLAEKHGVPIDIHLHEGGTLGAFTIDLILERVAALGMRGQVTISHAFALADLDAHAAAATAAALAEHDVAVATIAPGGNRVLPIATLAEHGVRIGLGQDGQRDYWSPYGNTDMLDRTWQLAFTRNLRLDELIEHCVAIATVGGASLIDPAATRLTGAGHRPGLAVGDPAELVLVPGETVTSAVMDRPAGRTTIHAGRVVAHDGSLV